MNLEEEKKSYPSGLIIRVTLIKVIRLKEPDRGPVMLPTGTVPLYMAGLTYKEAMYDSEKVCKAYTEAFHIFKGDDFAAPMIRAAKAQEIIKTKISKYRGHF